MTPDEYVFNRWAAKAPVNYEGPQRTAKKLFREVAPALTQEESVAVNTALSHALMVGEGRGEFDKIVDRIRRRLFNGKKRRTYKNCVFSGGTTR